MKLDRRHFLAAAGVAASACSELTHVGNMASGDAWDRVREQFALKPGLIDMSAMLLSSHPRNVREAIARHSRELDLDTAGYLHDNNDRFNDAAREAAGSYLATPARHIALVDSTTMGVGLVYAGLKLQPGDEILTTDQDYFVTHESVRLASARTGAIERRVSLHDQSGASDVSADHIVATLRSGITTKTRVIGQTWVHSSTGLKVPVREIANMIADENRSRGEAEQILFVVDGVHGFGNQNETLETLGCDFIAAGCHKWLFGPRGTGIVAGRESAWQRIDTSIPSFLDSNVFHAWITDREPRGATTGARLTPGGFKSFEHRWALPAAFALHDSIGKHRVEARTAELATQLKEGLASISGVALATPLSPAMSAGIVSFNIDGAEPKTVVDRLRGRNIVASVAPYAQPWVRLTPSIRNTPREIEVTLSEVRTIAGGAGVAVASLR